MFILSGAGTSPSSGVVPGRSCPHQAAGRELRAPSARGEPVGGQCQGKAALPWAGPYREEPLHPPVLAVGVPLRQRAAVRGVAVKGVVKTCREAGEVASSSSPSSPELSATTKSLGMDRFPSGCGFGCIPALPALGWERFGKEEQSCCCSALRALCELGQPGSAFPHSALVVQQNPSLGEALSSPYPSLETLLTC